MSDFDASRGAISRLLTDPLALDAAVDLVNAQMLSGPTAQREAWLQVSGREYQAVQALVLIVAVLLGRRPGRSRPELMGIRDELRMAMLEETFARPGDDDAG